MLISAPGLLSGIRLGLNTTLVGNNCNISTSQSYFGASSLRNIGTSGAYANVAPVTNMAFGTGDFTIELWYQPNSSQSTTTGILGTRPGATSGAYPVIATNYPYAGRQVLWFFNNGVQIQSANNVLTNNVWTNMAVVRNSGNTRIYINGNQSGGTYTNSSSIPAGRLILGADDFTVGGIPLNGYIDELRISNIARYTGNYIVATQPFINDGNTVLLQHYDQANISRNVIDDNS
jgi:hypothetical protein